MFTDIEVPFALLQEQVGALYRNAVEAPQMLLRLGAEVLDTIDVVSLIDEPLRVVDANVAEVRDIQGVIADETVCLDDAVRHDHPLHDRHQGSCPRIRDHNRVDPSTPRFNSPKTGILPPPHGLASLCGHH